MNHKLSSLLTTNNTSSKCLNCSESLPDQALYCPYCGQKNTDGRVTIGQFLKEFFDSVFNIDSRFFQTLFSVFIPGRLTIEYFKGRHKRYTHPLRLFFLLCVLHLTIINFVAIDKINLGFNPLDQVESNIAKKEIIALIDSFALEIADTSPNYLYTIDSLQSYLKSKSAIPEDSAAMLNLALFDLDSLSTKVVNIRYQDIALMPFDSLADKYEITDFGARIFLKQAIKANQDPKGFIRFGIANIVWMLLVLLPSLSLLMKILYIRRGFFFIEHLVYLYHWHSFSFIIMSVYFIGMNSIPVPFLGLFIGIIILFGFIALKRYYKQGFFKSLLKFLILLAGYFVMMMALMAVTGIISMLIF